MVKKYFNKAVIFGLFSLLLFCPNQVEGQEITKSDLYTEAPVPPADPSGENLGIENDTISLDLRGIEIKEFLKVLSKKLNKNIIPSKNVTGRVTLFLHNVRYEDVLDILMTSQGLAYEEKDNNVILVVTEAEYEALYGKKFNEKKQMMTLKAKYASPKTISTTLSNLKSTVGNIIVDEVTGTIILIDIPQKLKQMKEVFEKLDSPKTTEVFELQYAKAKDIEDDVSSILTDGASSVVADERTNTLIVTDLPGNIHKIKQAIQMLDQPTKQVFIEAAIVQITLEDEFLFGIEWAKIMNNPSFWDTVLTGSFPNANITSNSGYQEITLGTLRENNFTATLNFLDSLGDIKILSRPTLAITNNEEAVLHVGKKQAIITATTSQSGGSTITSDNVEFVDIGLKLTVIPTINRDGFITMKIKPEVSSVSSTVTTGSSKEPRSIIPIITTNEAETTVKIKDGSMLMIAGLRKIDNPSEKNQTEIVVFLTPHIIEGEDMMAWALKKLDEHPQHMWTENRGYFDPKLKETSFKKRKTGGTV